jgi:WD40-like Beta Propeller Repeat
MFTKIFKSLFILMLVFLLAACDGGAVAPSPTLAPAPTSTPLAAPTSTVAPTKKPVPTTLSATPTTAPAVSVARIAVQLPDNSVQLVDANGSQTLLAKLDNQVDLSSILATEGELDSPLYLPVTGNPSTVMQIDANGAKKLDWITGPLYGIAATSSRLAWGTADIRATMMAARIQISGVNGSGVKTGLEEIYKGVAQSLRVLRWSHDGTRLYFSKEPLGLGGYILFGGRTNLWSLDVSSGKATEVVHEIAPNAAVCIDDLSPDETQVADHCKVNGMEVINLTTKATRVITPPSDIPQFGVVGGARFSPDGSRLAYALARHDPSNEQGWVAVSEGTRGTSRLIATSPAKDYFWVAAWLDSDTIVLQSGMSPQGVWTVRADGSHLKRLADGIFLGIVGRSS